MVTLSDLSTCAKNDDNYCKLIATILKGFPSTRQQLDPVLREYWEVRSRLSVNKGIVFLDDRTVMPNKLRNQILDTLHSAHQGISSMRNRANNNIYWPRMSSSISNKRLTCIPCKRILPLNLLSHCRSPLSQIGHSRNCAQIILRSTSTPT